MRARSSIHFRSLNIRYGWSSREAFRKRAVVKHCPLRFPRTGHGGEPFIKFQDAEELTSVELADVFEQMWQKRRCVPVICPVLCRALLSVLQYISHPQACGPGFFSERSTLERRVRACAAHRIYQPPRCVSSDCLPRVPFRLCM